MDAFRLCLVFAYFFCGFFRAEITLVVCLRFLFVVCEQSLIFMKLSDLRNRCVNIFGVGASLSATAPACRFDKRQGKVPFGLPLLGISAASRSRPWNLG